MTKNEEFSMLNPEHQAEHDRAFVAGMTEYFEKSLGTPMDKLRNFSKYVPRQALTGFLAKHELFKRVLPVHGHIIECGVYLGHGLMTWANFSAIFEPVNHIRQIVGFDTFTGFADIHEKDEGQAKHAVSKQGGLASHALEDIEEAIRLYDLNRSIGHIPRVSLVEGNATETIPKFVEENQHLVVAMLYLDFDVYEPTKVALKHFLPRMPKGAILAFDELDQAHWPGETMAVLEEVGIRNLQIERFPFAPGLSFAVLS